jgi:integrase
MAAMGTIATRERSDGTKGYQAQIVIKDGKTIVHRETKTFDRKQAAAAWLERREKELHKPGGVERARKTEATLADAIDRYIAESTKKMGITKARTLASIKKHDIASMPCSKIGSDDIVAFATALLDECDDAGGQLRQPQTVGNYLSHLAAVFAIAAPAWKFELDPKAMKDAHAVLRRLGKTSKSTERTRRPTLAEIDKLMGRFVEAFATRPATSIPMHYVVGFALFSTRRQEEIIRITWKDLDEAGQRILVRDMKHPGQKAGNDTWCELPPEALAVALAMPRVADEIFPFNNRSVSHNFTRACRFLEIDDLHFHDLRHEGISRLFEMGKTIPQAASVSGHRSWQSLQRYAHLRQVGDKWAAWEWLSKLRGLELKIP